MIWKHISSQQKPFSTHISPLATLQALNKGLMKGETLKHLKRTSQILKHAFQLEVTQKIWETSIRRKLHWKGSSIETEIIQPAMPNLKQIVINKWPII